MLQTLFCLFQCSKNPLCRTIFLTVGQNNFGNKIPFVFTEVQKIVIDAFCGELGIPITTMFKYEVEVEEQGDVAQFLSQKLDFPDVDFIRKRLVCFDLKETKEAVSINGYSHDIGLVIVTQGKLQVFFAIT